MKKEIVGKTVRLVNRKKKTPKSPQEVLPTFILKGTFVTGKLPS